MKKGLVLIAFSLAGLATAYSQVKLQFVEVQMGQSVMSQGTGYSLFNKVVGDNLALSESIHLGWGKGPSRSTGAYVEMNTISMPNYDEIAAAFTMGLEMRRYIEINSSLRCHSGCSIGGIHVANGYTMANEKKTRKSIRAIDDMFHRYRDDLWRTSVCWWMPVSFGKRTVALII